MKRRLLLSAMAISMSVGLYFSVQKEDSYQDIEAYGLLAYNESGSIDGTRGSNAALLPQKNNGVSTTEKSDRTSPTVDQPLEISATAIGKFLNGNLPTTTPTGNTNVPLLLSQTGAFSDLATLEPNPGLIPYDMIEPFWSDGANKIRWMAIPNDGNHDSTDEQITYSSTEAWDFPKGSVLIKHFEFPNKRLETRFEVKGDDNVYYYLTYKWNQDQTDALLLNSSVQEYIEVNNGTQVWHYPSRNECASCHYPQNGNVLGPKTRNLNKTITYGSGSTETEMNQLVYLSTLGILNEDITNLNVNSYPKVFSKNDTSASLEDRARSYIDVNCASCHNPNVNNVALFDARYTTPLEDQNMINGAVVFDEGLPDPKVIVPQDVPNSMLHFRMNSTQTGIEMPPLAKDVVDTAGVQLIADWINSLDPSTSNPPVAAFTASSSYGTAPLPVTFDASPSFDEDGDTLTYTWHFGDGTGSQGMTTAHTYATPGSYSARLIVDDGQFSNEKQLTIVVNDGNAGSSTISFQDATALLPQDNYSGLPMGVIDMNGDGKDDIVQFNYAKTLKIQFQNGPGESFASHEHGTVSNIRQWSTAIADIDKNGYNDIISGGAYDNIKIIKNNNGSNSFTQSPLSNSNIFIQGSNFVDIDNDGWADLFACHDDAESRPYRNNEDGTLSYLPDLIRTLTVPASDNSGNYASMWVDYDNDGDLDLYISKCRAGVTDPTDPRRINMLFQNDGSHNFAEKAGEANLKIGDQTWLTDFGDIDNDGDLDAIVINHGTGPQLMRNNGNGTFTEITAGSGLLPTLDPENIYGIQGFFRDFDNDGYLDLMVSGNNHFLFYNKGDGTFQLAPNPFNSNKIHSFSIGDLNHDGFLDIYAGYATGLNTPSTIKDRLWINNGNNNNFLNVQLTGTASNPNAIGARVELHGPWGIQIRDVRSGEGYGLVNSFTQHFGIGASNTIAKVVVKWPSGRVDTVRNPVPNQFLQITESEEVAVTGVVIDQEDLTLYVGETINLEATVTPLNATNTRLSWTSSDPAIATINNSGGITALDQGTTVITVTTQDGGFTHSINLTVEPAPISVTGITLNSSEVILTEGENTTLIATVTPLNADNTEVMWTSDNTGIATVSPQGAVTAITAGTTTITATTVDGGYQATANVQVNAATVLVTSIELVPGTPISLPLGGSLQLETAIAPTNATDQSVTWNTSAASIVAVNANGRITAENIGTAYITVTSVDGGFQDSVEVTVYEQQQEVSVYNVLLSPASVDLEVGQTVQLTATVEPANATDTSVTWFSNDPNIASIGANGLVTATGAGTIDVSVRTNDGGYHASAIINVSDSNPGPVINVYDIKAAPAQITIEVGQTYQMTATVEPGNATDPTYTWFSNDPTIAAIDNTGMATGIGPGTIDVTVTSNDGGFRSSAIITVIDVQGPSDPVRVYDVKVAPQSIDLWVGNTFQMVATVEPSNADNTAVRWFSNDPSIVSIDENTGLITAVSPGVIDISAVTLDGGYHASAIITVYGQSGNADIVVYPNPTPGILYVDLYNHMGVAVDIQIFNQNNQLLRTQTFTADHPREISLDVGQYTQGYYYLVASSTIGRTTKAFLIGN